MVKILLFIIPDHVADAQFVIVESRSDEVAGGQVSCLCSDMMDARLTLVNTPVKPSTT